MFFVYEFCHFLFIFLFYLRNLIFFICLRIHNFLFTFLFFFYLCILISWFCLWILLFFVYFAFYSFFFSSFALLSELLLLLIIIYCCCLSLFIVVFVITIIFIIIFWDLHELPFKIIHAFFFFVDQSEMVPMSALLLVYFLLVYIFSILHLYFLFSHLSIFFMVPIPYIILWVFL